MIIKVDTREAALIQQIQKQISAISSFGKIEVKVETLPIGDIIISDDSTDLLIIERKSVADLLSSIKDGRYEEQSYRLNGLDHHNHNIIYLIEGDVNKLNPFKSNYLVEKLMIYSAMFSLNYYKGFSVFRSINMEETATIICNMAYKLAKTASTSAKQPYYTITLASASTSVPTPATTNTNTNTNTSPSTQPLLLTTSLYNNTGAISTHTEGQTKLTNHCEDEQDEQDEPDKKVNSTEKDYVNVIKKVKKENITPGNIGEIMLCQIPGISSVSALAIIEKYGTIANLIKELDNNPDCLNGISYTNAKGQVRKISKTCISNVVKFLLNK